MKPIVHKDLLRRLECASHNGSKVAAIILKELHDCGKNDASTILNSKTTNYFDCLRRVSNCGDYQVINMFVTCCSKDVENDYFPDKGNPNAPYHKDNRIRKGVTNFANMFNAVNDAYNKGEIDGNDVEYLENAFRCNKKITVTLSGNMSDIEKAYDGRNYCVYADSEESCLHKSCMRHNEVCSIAGDFYANFAGAKILYAHDEDGMIYGRAIVWPNMHIDGSRNCERSFMLLDRIYFAFDFVRKMIIDKAISIGCHFRKYRNTYDSKVSFYTLRDVEIYDGRILYANHPYDFRAYVDVPVHNVSYYKYGAPYLDTFTYLVKPNSKPILRLCNDSYPPEYTRLACLDATHGGAKLDSNICPICGKISESPSGFLDHLCSDCMNEYLVSTEIGDVLNCKLKEYNGKLFPRPCFNKRGKPNEALLLHERLVQLTRNC